MNKSVFLHIHNHYYINLWLIFGIQLLKISHISWRTYITFSSRASIQVDHKGHVVIFDPEAKISEYLTNIFYWYIASMYLVYSSQAPPLLMFSIVHFVSRPFWLQSQNWYYSGCESSTSAKCRWCVSRLQQEHARFSQAQTSENPSRISQNSFTSAITCLPSWTSPMSSNANKKVFLFLCLPWPSFVFLNSGVLWDCTKDHTLNVLFWKVGHNIKYNSWSSCMIQPLSLIWVKSWIDKWMIKHRRAKPCSGNDW